MQASKNWYAIYTKPRWEKKVNDLLVQQTITAYCPLNRVVRQWSDRKKVLHEPLFRGYVLVHVGANEMVKVKSTNGVISFVRWLGKPAVIRDEEIDTIRRFLNEHKSVGLEKAEVNVNDVVRIISGPLMEYEGSITAISKNKVKVYLPTLGYMMVVEVEKSNLEIVRH